MKKLFVLILTLALTAFVALWLVDMIRWEIFPFKTR